MDSEALKGRPAEPPSQTCRDLGEDLSQGEETVGQKESRPQCRGPSAGHGGVLTPESNVCVQGGILENS